MTAAQKLVMTTMMMMMMTTTADMAEGSLEFVVMVIRWVECRHILIFYQKHDLIKSVLILTPPLNFCFPCWQSSAQSKHSHAVYKSSTMESVKVYETLLIIYKLFMIANDCKTQLQVMKFQSQCNEKQSSFTNQPSAGHNTKWFKASKLLKIEFEASFISNSWLIFMATLLLSITTFDLL